MNFSPIWVNWIMESVTTVTYTLLINGSPSQSFKPEKGLRQGDPLSPYLFLFCASVLSIELMKAERNKEIKGVKLGRQGQTFTHLLFADDSLLFFQKDKYIVPNIQKIVSWNCNLSGQCINLSKSDLFCSPNMAEVEKVALVQSLQINLVQQPSKYLGMKFKLRRNRVADFQVLINSKPNSRVGKLGYSHKQEELPSSLLSFKTCLCTPSVVLKCPKQLPTKWTVLLDSGGVMNLGQGNCTC